MRWATFFSGTYQIATQTSLTSSQMAVMLHWDMQVPVPLQEDGLRSQNIQSWGKLGKLGKPAEYTQKKWSGWFHVCIRFLEPLTCIEQKWYYSLMFNLYIILKCKSIYYMNWDISRAVQGLGTCFLSSWSDIICLHCTYMSISIYINIWGQR